MIERLSYPNIYQDSARSALNLAISQFSRRFPFLCLGQGFARSNVLFLAPHNASHLFILNDSC
jgi:hypothetical protein